MVQGPVELPSRWKVPRLYDAYFTPAEKKAHAAEVATVLAAVGWRGHPAQARHGFL